jgi:virginiamycin B lyase
LNNSFILLSILTLYISSLILSLIFGFPYQTINAQLITQKDLVTYQKQSNFIKEFKIPLRELGLKGITTDSQGNAWIYHSTNQAGTILKFDPLNGKFTQYTIPGKTKVDNAIMNLAGGQLTFDDRRNAIWFTDARTNSIGKLDIKSGKIQLFDIPTQKSGPMGISLYNDGKSIWFTEITGNKLARLDITSNNSKILEYPVTLGTLVGQQDTGPTFLAFDKRGVLWVTMSYTHSVLRVEPWMLVPGSSSIIGGMSNFTIQPKTDIFSPFGIAILNAAPNNNSINSANTNTSERIATTTTTNYNDKEERIILSDHGSSRILVSSGNIDTNPLQNYTSYWNSPSQVYPATLPGQIIIDTTERNVYFPEHGGNRISKIDLKTGLLTEYDIPTGPLSTVLFIAVSQDGKKVWFTEWASNKIAYLDTTIPVPIDMHVMKNNKSITSTATNAYPPISLKKDLPSQTIDVSLLNKEKEKEKDGISINRFNPRNNTGNTTFTLSSPLLLNNVDLSVIGMTDSGLKGIQYTANPQSINMTKNILSKSYVTLQLGNTTEGNSNNDIISNIPRPGQYTSMVRASIFEKDRLLVSLLYPIGISLDIPIPKLQQLGGNSIADNTFTNTTTTKQNPLSIYGEVRQLALIAAIGLIGYLIYGRIAKRLKGNKKE